MKKTILLAISASIACYKMLDLISLLKEDYDLELIMTEGAKEFINPLLFSGLLKKPVYSDVFKLDEDYGIAHITLAQKADVLVIAPASADLIAKLAAGFADNLLTASVLAANCPIIIAPAMNKTMYYNPAVQRNLKRLKADGYLVIEPQEGRLACGDKGIGKLVAVETIKEVLEAALVKEKILAGKKVLVTAGPTREAIDPVRYITNHSSGKMGYALARAAYAYGGEVTLISGPTALKAPYGVKTINIQSADEMFETVKANYQMMDYIIKAAAVADFKVQQSQEKIKKDTAFNSLSLIPNPDILQYLGEHKGKQKLCGFAMETEDALHNAQKKFKAKNCDLLVLNDLRTPGAGFAVDTNVVTLITQDKTEKLELMSKDALAKVILRKLKELE